MQPLVGNCGHRNSGGMNLSETVLTSVIFPMPQSLDCEKGKLEWWSQHLCQHWGTDHQGGVEESRSGIGYTVFHWSVCIKASTEVDRGSETTGNHCWKPATCSLCCIDSWPSWQMVISLSNSLEHHRPATISWRCYTPPSYTSPNRQDGHHRHGEGSPCSSYQASATVTVKRLALLLAKKSDTTYSVMLNIIWSGASCPSHLWILQSCASEEHNHLSEDQQDPLIPQCWLMGLLNRPLISQHLKLTNFCITLPHSRLT